MFGASEFSKETKNQNFFYRLFYLECVGELWWWWRGGAGNAGVCVCVCVCVCVFVCVSVICFSQLHTCQYKHAHRNYSNFLVLLLLICVP